MTEVTNGAANSAQNAAKKHRRGVSNKTQAVAQLKFHEKDAAQNGLFVGHLEEVTVQWSTNEDSKSFPGLSVPRLTFHFESNHANVSERRHVYQTLFPVESNVLTIPGGKEEWKVNNVFNWIKHILDVFYLKGRELTEAEENALSLDFEDYNDNGEYIAVDPETVIASYRFIFDNVAAMLNGSFNIKEGETAKPCYKTADGKIIPCWLKLLRHKRVKNNWVNVTSNGDLGFDGFIGSGVVELVKRDCPPSVLRIDLAKESITPKETKKMPSIGAPSSPMGMGSVMPGNMPFNDNPANDAFNDASSDMPFGVSTPF